MLIGEFNESPKNRISFRATRAELSIVTEMIEDMEAQEVARNLKEKERLF